MNSYTADELQDALQPIASMISKTEKAQAKFSPGASHHTLLRNRLRALYIASEFITTSLSEIKDKTT